MQLSISEFVFFIHWYFWRFSWSSKPQLKMNFQNYRIFFHTDISHTKALGCLKLVCLNCMVSFIELIVIKISLIITKLDLNKDQGPVIQSIVSLTSSLRVISFTVLADSIYDILIFFAEKMWVAFALQKLLTFFQQKISAYLHIPQCKF